MSGYNLLKLTKECDKPVSGDTAPGKAEMALYEFFPSLTEFNLDEINDRLDELEKNQVYSKVKNTTLKNLRKNIAKHVKAKKNGKLMGYEILLIEEGDDPGQGIAYRNKKLINAFERAKNKKDLHVIAKEQLEKQKAEEAKKSGFMFDFSGNSTDEENEKATKEYKERPKKGGFMFDFSENSTDEENGKTMKEHKERPKKGGFMFDFSENSTDEENEKTMKEYEERPKKGGFMFDFDKGIGLKKSEDAPPKETSTSHRPVAKNHGPKGSVKILITPKERKELAEATQKQQQQSRKSLHTFRLGNRQLKIKP